MALYKTLLDNEALAAGASSIRWYVAGMEETTILVGACTYNGGLFEVWYVITTADGEIELKGHFQDMTTNAWHPFQIGASYVACSNIPVMKATWMFLKEVGGTGITGAEVHALSREEAP